jgi:hypothetical protein
MESLTGPKEVWWLTPYESESDRQRVVAGYANNPELMAALLEIPKPKQGLVGAPIDILANYRRDLSEKDSWKVGGTRFFVVTVTKGEAQPDAVFEAADGTRFVLRPATTRRQADALVAAAGSRDDRLRHTALLGHAGEGMDRRRPGVLEAKLNGTIQIENRWLR